jgi:hypothetical protein
LRPLAQRIPGTSAKIVAIIPAMNATDASADEQLNTVRSPSVIVPPDALNASSIIATTEEMIAPQKPRNAKRSGRTGGAAWNTFSSRVMSNSIEPELSVVRCFIKSKTSLYVSIFAFRTSLGLIEAAELFFFIDDPSV